MSQLYLNKLLSNERLFASKDCIRAISRVNFVNIMIFMLIVFITSETCKFRFVSTLFKKIPTSQSQICRLGRNELPCEPRPENCSLPSIIGRSNLAYIQSYNL